MFLFSDSNLCFCLIDIASTEIYTLSLHDALPISPSIHPQFTTSPREYLFGAHTRCRMCSRDRKSTRLNSSHVAISYAVFCLKKKTSVRLSAARRPKFRVRLLWSRMTCLYSSLSSD